MKLLGIVGKAYSGKDSIADHLIECYGFVKLSLAAPLKAMCALAFDLTTEQVNGSEKAVVDPRYGKSPRDILQFIGTEGFRAVDPDCWVKLLLRQAEKEPRPVVVPDVRFVNEAKLIREAGGEIWRVVCPDHPKNAAMTENQQMHASEIEQAFIPPKWIERTFTAPYGALPALFELVDNYVR